MSETATLPIAAPPGPLTAREASARSAISARTLIAAAALIVFLVHAVNYLYFFVDDEGIPFVFAQNVLNGHGLSYNPLDGPVEGYSDFLSVWLDAAILGAVRLLHLDKIAVFFIGKGLSLLFGCCTIVLTARLLARLRITRASAVAGGMGFVALAGPLAVWSASSLETALFALLVLALTYALADDSDNATSDRLAAAAAVAVTLARIDGFVYAAAVIAAFIVWAPAYRRKALFRRVVVPLALAFAAYHTWRMAYFHRVLPAPVAAKVLFKLRWQRVIARLPAQGYAIRYFQMAFWIPAVAVVATLVTSITHDRRIAALASATALLTAYVAIVGDWMFGFRFFTALVPLMAVMVGWTIARGATMTAIAPAAAALVLFASAQSAWRFEQTYESEQRRASWLRRPTEGMDAYFGPLYGLEKTICALARPGDTTACNLAGFVPFMSGLPNIDNLGLCTRFFAELPTTDVIFTEVGRYSPMTAKPVLRTADAYLMYRAPTFVIEPAKSVSLANNGVLPATLFGGRYRLLQNDPSNAHAIFVRAAPLDDFRRRPDLFLENLAHPSSVVSVRVGGRTVPPARVAVEFPYLAEDAGELTFNGELDVDVRMTRAAVPIHEVYVGAISSSVPVDVEVKLLSSNDVVFVNRFELRPGMTVQRFDRLPEPVLATRLWLHFSTPGRTETAKIWMEDVRVQGQSPQLADYIGKNVNFER